MSYASVQFSHSVISDSLWPHGLQHTGLPCPSTNLRAYSNSCPLSPWCHLTISPSVDPFSSCPQSFPASGSFSNESVLPIMWPKYWSFSFNISPSVNTQDWFPLGLTGWISLQFKRSQESSPTPQFKSINSSVFSFLYSAILTSLHVYWKNQSFD